MTCMDSRLLLDQILGLGIGDAEIIRNAGMSLNQGLVIDKGAGRVIHVHGGACSICASVGGVCICTRIPAICMQLYVYMYICMCTSHW